MLVWFTLLFGDHLKRVTVHKSELSNVLFWYFLDFYDQKYTDTVLDCSLSPILSQFFLDYRINHAHFCWLIPLSLLLKSSTFTRKNKIVHKWGESVNRWQDHSFSSHNHLYGSIRTWVRCLIYHHFWGDNIWQNHNFQDLSVALASEPGRRSSRFSAKRDRRVREAGATASGVASHQAGSSPFCWWFMGSLLEILMVCKVKSPKSGISGWWIMMSKADSLRWWSQWWKPLRDGDEWWNITGNGGETVMKIQKGMISNGRTGGAGGVNSGSTRWFWRCLWWNNLPETRCKARRKLGASRVACGVRQAGTKASRRSASLGGLK